MLLASDAYAGIPTAGRFWFAKESRLIGNRHAVVSGFLPTLRRNSGHSRYAPDFFSSFCIDEELFPAYLRKKRMLQHLFCLVRSFFVLRQYTACVYAATKTD